MACAWHVYAQVSEAQLLETLKRVGRLVDQQNAYGPSYRPLAPSTALSRLPPPSLTFPPGAWAARRYDPSYHPLAPRYDGPEWRCALELVLNGRSAPNGYTEPALTKHRRERKAIEAAKAAAADEAAAHTPLATPAIRVGGSSSGYRRGGSSMSGAA